MTTFRAFVHTVVRRAGTRGAVARAIGISESAFSRGLNNEGTFGEETLLRLAEFSGESPVNVLTLAGKGEFVKLVEKLFGPERRSLSGPERELHDRWHALNPAAQDALLTFLGEITKRDRGPKKP